MKKVAPEMIDLAFTASCFREEMDDLLLKYNARMGIGWYGKWAKLQVLFPDVNPDHGVTLIEVAKGKSMRYLLHVEEDRAEDVQAPLSVDGRIAAMKTLEDLLVQAAFGKVDVSKWLDKVMHAAFRQSKEKKKIEIKS